MKKAESLLQGETEMESLEKLQSKISAMAARLNDYIQGNGNSKQLKAKSQRICNKIAKPKK